MAADRWRRSGRRSAEPASVVYLPLVIRDATYRTGKGTYYNVDSAGNCSFDPSPDDLMVAAMNHADYGNAALCGTFIEIIGPKGRVVVRIVDRCPECARGDVDMSLQAFARMLIPLLARPDSVAHCESGFDGTNRLSL
jgi:expansin (peptidoglycan-binding protein)